jgi:predicted secreted protein
MGWLAGIFVYLICWWLVLFTVLPWGVRVPDQAEPGHATSAPSNPQLRRKLIITTVIAAVVWGLIDLVMLSGWISFRDATPP